jgi:hypothetical protein
VQRSSLLVSFLWKVWPQLMQISRPLSFLPMPRLWRAEASVGKTPCATGVAEPGFPPDAGRVRDERAINMARASWVLDRPAEPVRRQG